MTFERPEMLALAPLLVLVGSLGVLARWRRGLRLVEAYGGAGPGHRLAARDLTRVPTARLIALAVAVAVLTIAASGPERSRPVTPPSEQALDVVVIVDLSRSMTAPDVRGSRGERARTALTRIGEALGAERVAIVVFADRPSTLVPPTDDPGVVRWFASALSSDLVAERDQGSDLAAALVHARRALDGRRREGAGGALVLLSDGEVHDGEERVLDSTRVAAAGGVRVWTAGVGTPEGTRLPALEGEARPPLDDAGAPVVARMNAGLLRSVAEAGGGTYHDVSDDRGLDALVATLAEAAGGSERDAGGADLAWWLTLLGLVALCVEAVTDSRHRRVGPASDEEGVR